MARAIRGSPRMMCQSWALTLDASTRTSTSSGAGAGMGKVSSESTDGGPYRRWTTAVIVETAGRES